MVSALGFHDSFGLAPRVVANCRVIDGSLRLLLIFQLEKSLLSLGLDLLLELRLRCMLARRQLAAHRALRQPLSAGVSHADQAARLRPTIELKAFHEPIDLFILHLKEHQSPFLFKNQLRFLLQPMLDAETVRLRLQLLHILIHLQSFHQFQPQLFIDSRLLLLRCSHLLLASLIEIVDALGGRLRESVLHAGDQCVVRHRCGRLRDGLTLWHLSWPLGLIRSRMLQNLVLMTNIDRIAIHQIRQR